MQDIKRRAEVLKQELEKEGIKVDAIYLFGSYARGEFLRRSDIDLIVISRDFSEIPFLRRLDIVNRIVWKKELGNLEILPFTHEEIEEKVVARDARKYWKRLI
jgi:predicted nucleotidyltransferase